RTGHGYDAVVVFDPDASDPIPRVSDKLMAKELELPVVAFGGSDPTDQGAAEFARGAIVTHAPERAPALRRHIPPVPPAAGGAGGDRRDGASEREVRAGLQPARRDSDYRFADGGRSRHADSDQEPGGDGLQDRRYPRPRYPRSVANPARDHPGRRRRFLLANP